MFQRQDLCLATLEGHERLEYAKGLSAIGRERMHRIRNHWEPGSFCIPVLGRKDAGSKFFKRDKFESALERYSLAAEMLGHRDDIKDRPGASLLHL